MVERLPWLKCCRKGVLALLPSFIKMTFIRSILKLQFNIAVAKELLQDDAEVPVSEDSQDYIWDSKCSS